MLQAPAIITTAPTSEPNRNTVQPQKPRSPSSNVLSIGVNTNNATASTALSPTKTMQAMGQSVSESDLGRLSDKASRVKFREPERHRSMNAPPPYGDESSTSLALPISRLSESSKSDASSSDHIYASTTTHTVSTTTTFFRLPRRKKQKGPLFPLPVKIPPTDRSLSTSQTTPFSDTSPSGLQASSHKVISQSASRGIMPSIKSPFTIPSPDLRRDSTTSTRSTSPFRAKTLPNTSRDQSHNSLGHAHDDESLATPTLPPSTRTSTSTTRTSLGGLFNISRLRQNSEPQTRSGNSPHPPLPATPVSAGSKPHSVTLTREPLELPERQEGDTPAKYLIRLEDIVSRGAVAAVLAQSDDEFSKNVLRSYMRGFKFFGDPLDMSIRKLLMVAELPKETQQIDRVLQAFANRYYECNPGIFATPDETYFIAFSVLILHTDVFNKNNKNKMQKPDYTKNTRGYGVADEILECFYDNISYTPFIRVEDDLNVSGERATAAKPKKSLFTKQSTDAAGKPSREPVDPYTLILDNRLDNLRPSLKEVMNLDDHYTYHSQGGSCHYGQLHESFFKYGDLQIVSSRSRPDAFMTPETVANPADAHPGVVDIKVTKAGILWRKDPKKKKARSPWQEWGAILTGTQLYFFRNANWVKTLMHQHDSQSKRARGAPIVFRPPLDNFKPDVLMSTEDAVALQDLSYKKHKHAFVFVRRGGLEEVFLADTEQDFNEWLSDLNYAAAFHTAGVRIRSWSGDVAVREKQPSNQRGEGAQADQVTGPESSATASVALQDSTLTKQIKAARRQVLAQKIVEAKDMLKDHHTLLENHLRNARHLQTLAPIQNRTREQVVLAAGAMSARIKWTRIEIWRTQCHHDIWVQDLENELGQGSPRIHRGSVAGSSLNTSPSSRSASVSREKRVAAALAGFKNNAMSGEIRPATQPAPESVDIDDMFNNLHIVHTVAHHRPKGSWELPPFTFQPGSNSYSQGAASRSNISAAPPDSEGTPHVPSFERSILREPTIVDGDQATAASINDGDGHHTDSSILDTNNRPVTPRNHDAERGHLYNESEGGEASDGRKKARRSFQRSLRDYSTSATGHSRSKRGKDSNSSAGFIENDQPKPEAEILARSPGSFTLHGKKASVVKLGSEWQNLSALPRGEESIKNSLPWVPRPISTTSISTSATDTVPLEEEAFEEALEHLTETDMENDE